MLALLLLATGPETAIDAERAFNRAAQKDGQWTAFREFMADDAVVFTPQPTKAKEALPDKDPPIAVQWWPAESYVSCDGTMAVNTGSWVRPNAVGYFTTLWVRGSDSHYKWLVDHGDALTVARPLPERPKVRTAACQLPKGAISLLSAVREKSDSGRSADYSLFWQWSVSPDGARTFEAWLWNGQSYEVVVLDEVAAPK